MRLRHWYSDFSSDCSRWKRVKPIIIDNRSAPTDAAAYKAKGLILAKLGNYEEAVHAYDEAFRLNPHDPDIHQMKGQILLKLSPSIPPHPGKQEKG